jgi:hypothetical protein
MMRRGAEKVQNKIRGMTSEDQVAFWRERSRKLSRQQVTTEDQGNQEAPGSE